MIPPSRLAVVLCGWLWLISLTAQACPDTDCVRIGSWNIEWLGSDKRDQPVDQPTLNAMAAMIADEWSIDLITLHEINTTLHGEYRGEHYSLDAWKGLQQALERRGYHTATGNSGKAQHIVMAWRNPVVPLILPADMAVPDQFVINEFCRSSNLRKPLAGRFRAGQFDFWLIGIHLKSGVGNTACSSAVRERQSADIAQALPLLTRKDADVLIAGDFNATARHRTLAPLQDAGFYPISDKQHRSTHSSRISHIGNQNKKPGSGTQLDQIMLLPASQPEWQHQSTQIYKPDSLKIFADRFSDHLPIWADFSTDSDDD
ncbi:MAG: hypothetical protein IT470_00755 [Pseudomonadales bacterium]|nr:hypothetical protein [Pseudomonadales bacterium]